MDVFLKFLPPLMVALFMFYYSRQQSKRDREKESREKAVKQLNQILTKGVVINMEASTTVLSALKKLKDEKGRALLNGEVRAISDKVVKFNEELEQYLIEK